MYGASYLQNYGWKSGEALQKGGLKKPILMRHKKDTKGLGHQEAQQATQDLWWERVFDGQLKSLDVSTAETDKEDLSTYHKIKSATTIVFKQNDFKVSGMQKQDSPLYRNFVFGGILKGTLGIRGMASSSTVEEQEKPKSSIIAAKTEAVSLLETKSSTIIFPDSDSESESEDEDTEMTDLSASKTKASIPSIEEVKNEENIIKKSKKKDKKEKKEKDDKKDQKKQKKEMKEKKDKKKDKKDKKSGKESSSSKDKSLKKSKKSDKKSSSALAPKLDGKSKISKSEKKSKKLRKDKKKKSEPSV